MVNGTSPDAVSSARVMSAKAEITGGTSTRSSTSSLNAPPTLFSTRNRYNPSSMRVTCGNCSATLVAPGRFVPWNCHW